MYRDHHLLVVNHWSILTVSKQLWSNKGLSTEFFAVWSVVWNKLFESKVFNLHKEVFRKHLSLALQSMLLAHICPSHAFSCCLCIQWAEGTSEAGASGAHPTAETEPPVSRNALPEDQQPTEARWDTKILSDTRKILSGSSVWSNCHLFISDKLWYCRLSPNLKVLHYGDVEVETEMPSIEALQEKSESDCFRMSSVFE